MSWKQLVKTIHAPFSIFRNDLAFCVHKRWLKSGLLLLASFIGVVYQSTFD